MVKIKGIHLACNSKMLSKTYFNIFSIIYVVSFSFITVEYISLVFIYCQLKLLKKY
jgi:hypothetical protein